MVPVRKEPARHFLWALKPPREQDDSRLKRPWELESTVVATLLWTTIVASSSGTVASLLTTKTYSGRRRSEATANYGEKLWKGTCKFSRSTSSLLFDNKNNCHGLHSTWQTSSYQLKWSCPEPGALFFSYLLCSRVAP